MKKETDEYCEKIFMVIAVSDEKKIRFNELHRRFERIGAKMSKPTLIKHLNHLTKNKIIQRNQEDKQKVSYGLNWKRFKQLQKTKKINGIALHFIKEKKAFKSISLEEQTTYIHAILIISELFNLKLTILSILEPENKLQNYFTQTFITRFFNIYAKLLLDSCKDSKENAQKIIHHINESINTLSKEFFEIPTEINLISEKTNQQS